MHISERKQQRLRALATPGGVIAALAMDQRKSLRRMIAEASATEWDTISDAQVEEFKSAVTSVLSHHASAILLDSDYGLAASQERASGCGLLMTYEADGYENPRPHRMLALTPSLSVRRLRDMGADAIKILLSYAPDDEEKPNDEKRALIERIGYECAALDLPFFLEPLMYDPAGTDPKGFEFSKAKPQMVVRTMEEFSKDVYQVDVLKVEFPVNVAFVEGSAVYAGRSAYSRQEALEWYRQADAAARRPYIYLSAGIGSAEFVESLRLGEEAGTRYSGVLCGRANWQGGVSAYAKGGKQALVEWLSREGVRNVQAVNECLRNATPWHHWLSGTTAATEKVLA